MGYVRVRVENRNGACKGYRGEQKWGVYGLQERTEMHVAFYLEILKKEGNLSVPNIHGRASLCDCVNWIQLIYNREQERILFKHCNGFLA
jgi:hypothetical protein